VTTHRLLQNGFGTSRIVLLAAFLCVILGANLFAGTITVNVEGSDGLAVEGFYYTLERDLFYKPDPGTLDPDQQALNFNRSHMPVVTKGASAGASAAITLPEITPGTDYFVSVLPTEPGMYMMGGAPVKGGETVTVILTPQPVATAQITVFVFHDNAPLNNVADLPEELGLAGFTVTLEDAGGSYGASAGALTADAFGNMLGTTYQTDNQGNVVLDPDGNPNPTGMAPLVTDADGRLTIKYLVPAKYGVSVIPPQGQGWQQTSTIEGTKIIDAWVKANEPAFFQEFGPPGPHAEFGFIQPTNDTNVLTGGATVSGIITNLHMSPPPIPDFYSGATFEHTTPWVGLNTNGGLTGSSEVAYAAPVNADGSFSIPNVPAGDWQLVVFDSNLDLIFAFHALAVEQNGGGYLCNAGTCALGEIPVFQWYTRLEHYVFEDDNENGMMDMGEAGMGEQTINIRFPDGSLYQTFPTDAEGFVPFDQVFPFFAWQVAEVDYGRFKATGLTAVVDAGGPIPGDGDWTLGGQLNPQVQSPTPDKFRVELSTDPGTGEYAPVLTQGFQGFIGQTSGMMWGKKAYEPGENGGISGVVYYATVRAEDDPRFAGAEPIEPGIPNIEVNLYTLNEYTSADNPDPALLTADNLTLVATTTTDSWDDNPPDGCIWDGAAGFMYNGVSFPTYRSCFDGLRVFNQIRPGVFDGGYAFLQCEVLDGHCVAPDTGGVPGPLPTDVYVVEVVPPVDSEGDPIYNVQSEASKNVDFGDTVVPAIPPPFCANYDGGGIMVPAELELFPGVASAFADQYRPVCDRKILRLAPQLNAATDFFLYTQAPIAAHAVGMILDDATNEFDPNSPQFGEKYAPPWVPISFHDYTGREISRIVSDQFGRFNALLPSTYTDNVPSPSGVSPNMLISCMNSRTLPDGSPDPNYDKKYSQFCYTLQYLPGKSTYLDTPVVPAAAFTGGDQFPVDCELPDQTPRIASVTVNNGVGGGPFIPATGGSNQNPATATSFFLTIDAVGTVPVPNPDYCPGPPIVTDGSCTFPYDTNPTVLRDYGFGGDGTVVLAPVGGGPPVSLTGIAWFSGSITATVPAGTPRGRYELAVVRDDSGHSSINGVTVTVGLFGNRNNPSSTVRQVGPGESIQAAIDAAGRGDLILVEPGTYNEPVIMWKPVQLQGWGETTIIDAVKKDSTILENWRAKTQSLVDGNNVSLLPGQEAGAVVNGVEPVLFFSDEGAGVFVLPRANGNNSFQQQWWPRIDGFTIVGADTGGGISVNGYADYLTVSNNRITNNTGNFGGGVRIGQPLATDTEYVDADNDNVSVRHNQILSNGGIEGAGGGVSICTGSDNYQVVENYICGNFTMGDGAGIGHLGRSDNGLIQANTVILNENFNQMTVVSGGGIFIGGQPPLAGQTLSPGSGSVKVNGNWIQSNVAGVGDGGGIKTANVNGQELFAGGNNPPPPYQVDIFNNMIVNNIAALAGGGISLQDTAFSRVIHNTVAHNDSTATSGQAFAPGSPNVSTAQPAGIVSRAHSAGLLSALSLIGNFSEFSDPDLRNNIVWENRSFNFDTDHLEPVSAPWNFWDLAVIGTVGPEQLSPEYSVLTDTTGYSGTNSQTNPDFLDAFFNGGRGTTFVLGEPTVGIQVPAAFDEGGNFIRIRFGPLEPFGDYHIDAATSLIIDDGDPTAVSEDFSLSSDIDMGPRPVGDGPASGADEEPPTP